MSPRERELQAQLEERDNKLAEHERQRQEWESEQEQAKETAQLSQTYDRLSALTAKALQLAKIAPAHAPEFLGSIASEIDRNERLGLDYDENDLAAKVLAKRAEMSRGYYSGLDVAALADEFEAMEVEDPAQPGKKTTRAKLLMLEYAKRLRAKHGNGTPIPVSGYTNGTQPPRQQQREMTMEEKMDAARTFGGGAR